MRSRKKTLITGLVVACISMIIVQFLPGARTPESCKELREQVRQYTTNDSGLSWVIASVSESAMSKALQERYGTLTAEDCTGMLPQLSLDREAQLHTAWAPKMHDAGVDAITAITQCHAKRVRGEIKTHVESAQCSNTQIESIYKNAGYPYMDLVTKFADKRMEWAQKVDASLTGAEEDQLPFAALALEVAETERERLTAKQGTSP